MLICTGRGPLIRPKTAAPPAGITIGTVGFGTHNSSDNSGTTGYTFAAPTIDGGGAALICVVFWNPSTGNETDDMSALTPTFTLNGAAYDTMLALFADNSSGNRVVQATAALWTSPASGSVVFQPGASMSNITGASLCFLNVSGLHASPVGVIARATTANVSSLANPITTGTASSMVLALAGSRTNGKTPFTFSDSGFQTNKIGDSTGAAAGDGSYSAAYRTGLAIGTYAAGFALNASDSARVVAMAVELKAA